MLETTDILRKCKIKQIPKKTSCIPDIQENDEVGNISFLFERHCQTSRLYYKQAVLYMTKYHRLRRFLVFS